MPFSPRVPYKKPVTPLTEIPGECYGPDSLVLNGDTYNRYPYLFEFRFTKSGACKLFVKSDRKACATAGGYGYDKKGVCMAQWFTKTFAAELKAIFDQPKFMKQLDGSSMGQQADGTAHPWYCMYRDGKTGHISINGMSGLGNVVYIMERAFGLTLRYIGETNDSTLYMLAKHIPPKRK